MPVTDPHRNLPSRRPRQTAIKKAKRMLVLIITGAMLLICLRTQAWAADVLRIGVIWEEWKTAPSGPSAPYRAVEMIRDRINGSGGLEVGGKAYTQILA
jgi:hypothetical protein